MMIAGLISAIIILLFIRIYISGYTRIAKVLSLNFWDIEHENLPSVSEENKALVLHKAKECLIVVTDPVGQKRTGEIACAMAKNTLQEAFKHYNGESSPKDFLKQACFRAHRRISEQMNFAGGGCSIAILYIKGKKLYWASSGNIGIYLLGKELEQLNQMDLYKHKLSEVVLQGKINKGEVLRNHLKNELTSYLGYENFRKIELNEEDLKLKSSHQLFIATRKVYETLYILEIEKLLRGAGRPSRKIKKIKKAFFAQVKDETKEKKTSASQPVIALAFRFHKHKVYKKEQ